MEGKGSQFAEIVQRHLGVLGNCVLCPWECKADRLSGKKGVCGVDAGFHISSICLHKGEEPVIGGESGICNIFFSSCNLSCIYCQNWQISSRKGDRLESVMSLEEVIDAVIPLLDSGCKAVGFVSPTHYIPHVKAIIEALRRLGRSARYVYNSNGYDKPEEIMGLEDYIDVYLPDFKYADPKLAKALSGAVDYPEKAFAAIKEMYRQKGSTLILDEDGQAESGLVIRHLVLPGNVENSLGVLNQIERISPSISISLMSQYWPTPNVKEHHDLGRFLAEEEYESVKVEMERLGFYKGWIQEMDSRHNYRPDFLLEHPFEKDESGCY